MLLTVPSFYAHVATATLILAAIVVAVMNFSQLRQLEPFNTILLLLLASIAVGVHGLSHLGLETTYKFNPLQQIF